MAAISHDSHLPLSVSFPSSLPKSASAQCLAWLVTEALTACTLEKSRSGTQDEIGKTFPLPSLPSPHLCLHRVYVLGVEFLWTSLIGAPCFAPSSDLPPRGPLASGLESPDPSPNTPEEDCWHFPVGGSDDTTNVIEREAGRKEGRKVLQRIPPNSRAAVLS